MKINKNSAYNDMIKWFGFWLMFLIIWIALIIMIKLYFAFIGLFFLSILYWGISLISWTGLADIELNKDSFYLITFFNRERIYYDDFMVYNIIRGNRPIVFIIYSNCKKIRIAYTENNCLNIKSLLLNTKSKYTLDQFETMMNKFTIKPGFFD